jgi:4-azaleucine resistance transporter AzlC
MEFGATGSPTSVSHQRGLQKDFVAALADGFPLSVSVFVYGVAYGALAHTTNHLSIVQTLSLSVFLFAGASQFTVLALLQQGAVLAVIVSSVFLLNARQILYGLSLGPYLRHISWRPLVFLSHGLTDECYSISIVAARARTISSWYFAGAGCAVFIPWFVSSALGYLLGGFINHPETFGLDFAYIGAFTGLFIAQWTCPRRVSAGIVALLGAIAAGNWYGTTGAVLVGAIIAFTFGVTAPITSTKSAEEVSA